MTEDEIGEIGARALFGTLVANVSFEKSCGRGVLRKQSRAYLAALRAAGLAVVPVAPTSEMMVAGGQEQRASHMQM